MSDKEKAIEALRQIEPSRLDYNDWLAVGMALKGCGCTVEDWDGWSKKDTKRYQKNTCARKWAGFRADTVTLGTLVKLCRDHGGRIETRDEGHELDWNAIIGSSENESPIRAEWVGEHDMPQCPENWNPVDDLCRYLETLFSSEEHVGYVTESWESESGKYLPRRGCWDRPAGKLLEELRSCGGIIANVIGDWREECGAWIRFNPLDGKDCKDANVTDYRFALIECDSLPVERQYDLYTEMELPIAAMVHSGGKSLHAIVRVDAPNFEEYRKRVDFLYEICKKSGIEIDRQNRNPSRLSRLPGATRNGKRQYLVATNVGKTCWQEWRDWIEAQNDNLPNAETLADCWDNLPPLADEVISGVLRHGHKMLIAGPSKAGKSFLLIELAIALAEGKTWLGWQCKQGRVLYVNLELDAASCMHRFRASYEAAGIPPNNLQNIDIWNLRGKAMPMDKLAPRLIRRAAKRGYLAVIIDPIYKVITGDENSASEMANFCNQFDRICAELGTATIYCHHHSKGAQGGKAAADRASGSGVFARDPDATLDIIELKLDRNRREVVADRMACEASAAYLDRALGRSWREDIAQDDVLVWTKFQGWVQSLDAATDAIAAGLKARSDAYDLSAWRVEGTLREFKTFAPRRVFFKYPVHLCDTWGLLLDAKAEGEIPSRDDREAAIARKQEETKDETLMAFEVLCEDGKPVEVGALAEYLSIDVRSVGRRLSKIKTLTKKNGLVFRATDADTDNTSKCPTLDDTDADTTSKRPFSKTKQKEGDGQTDGHH